MNAEPKRSTEPPRGETDLYGDPVAESEADETYFEAYVSDHYNKLFVVKYGREQSGEWMKEGMERMTLEEFFEKGDMHDSN